MVKKEPLFWLVIAVLFFLPFIGNVHLFDWDEINFAEIAREMLFSGNYTEPQVNFQPFLEKPPLFFWLQALCMQLFGVSEFSARLPNAMLGVLQLPLLYLLGKKLKGAVFGRLWALAYFGTLLPHLYFKSGIIDPWFNFFIFSSLCLVYFSIEQPQGRPGKFPMAFGGGLLAGLAVFTKGPVALLIGGLTLGVFVLWKKRRWRDVPSIGLYVGAGLFISCGSWLLIDYLQYGSVFLRAFTQRQWELLTTEDAGHGGFFLYHVVVLLFGCFPSSVFMLQGIFRKTHEEEEGRDFIALMKVLFWVVLILFTAVQTKIVHYSSLCYFPLTFLAAVNIEKIIDKSAKLERWMRLLLGFTAFPLVVAPVLMCWLGYHIDFLKTLLKADPFAVENMNAEIHWSGWEFLPGLLMFGLLLYFLSARAGQNWRRSFAFLFAGTAIYIQMTLIFFIGRIEGISQNANVEFWQSKAGEDCYLLTYGYKSYTPYFYGQVRPSSTWTNADSLMMSKNLDKDLYLSCKVHKRKELEQRLPDARLLYHRNGFYFYLRKAVEQ